MNYFSLIKFISKTLYFLLFFYQKRIKNKKAVLRRITKSLCAKKAVLRRIILQCAIRKLAYLRVYVISFLKMPYEIINSIFENIRRMFCVCECKKFKKMNHH